YTTLFRSSRRNWGRLHDDDDGNCHPGFPDLRQGKPGAGLGGDHEPGAASEVLLRLADPELGTRSLRSLGRQRGSRVRPPLKLSPTPSPRRTRVVPGYLPPDVAGWAVPA